jgi:hypothetical protein
LKIFKVNFTQLYGFLINPPFQFEFAFYDFDEKKNNALNIIYFFPLNKRILKQFYYSTKKNGNENINLNLKKYFFYLPPKNINLLIL